MKQYVSAHRLTQYYHQPRHELVRSRDLCTPQTGTRYQNIAKLLTQPCKFDDLMLKKVGSLNECHWHSCCCCWWWWWWCLCGGTPTLLVSLVYLSLEMPPFCLKSATSGTRVCSSSHFGIILLLNQRKTDVKSFNCSVIWCLFYVFCR